MNILSLFAWRYIRKKKSTQAIQIISWVSIGAMAVGAASLIVVLSVFNGFEGFIKNLYSSYYPEIKISPMKGKNMPAVESYLKQLAELEGIKSLSQTIEEKVLFTFNEQQVIATLKGVDTAYKNLNHFEQHVRYGVMDFNKPSAIPPIVLGIGVSNRLGASEETHRPIMCYAFAGGDMSNLLSAGSAYRSTSFEVTGVYTLQEEIDNQIVFAPLDIVQELLGKTNQISSIEIALMPSANMNEIRNLLKAMAGSKDLKIETRYEQNRTLYFILKSERWAVYAILTLMLMIASFNIIGSMSMLVLDKSKDIAILKAMGMPAYKVKAIFLTTGVLLATLGGLVGCALAWIVCTVQSRFGIVRLGSGEAFLMDAYPVKMHAVDFVLVIATVMFIALIASWIPAFKASKQGIHLSVSS